MELRSRSAKPGAFIAQSLNFTMAFVDFSDVFLRSLASRREKFQRRDEDDVGRREALEDQEDEPWCH
jgi:hypothetical protein